MFELTTLTEARLASVTNRIEKHGDEDVPAVSLTVEFTAENVRGKPRPPAGVGLCE